MQLVRSFLGIALLCVGIAIGLGVGAALRPSAAATESPASAAQASVVWTCSMHPQIRMPKKGTCPICFMDLIPADDGGAAGESETAISLSPRAAALAHLESTVVERRALVRELHLVGKVAADETRVSYVSSYVPGRLDRLFVDFTGVLVRKGDHLAEMFSPELLVAQREYLVALDGVERTRSQSTNSPTALLVATSMYESAKRKLELWGVPTDEVARLEREKTLSDKLRIDSPREGWVTERLAFEGMYVEVGTRLFTVVDLRHVWATFEAYESDLPFLAVGQDLTFEAEAFPGRVMNAKIAYLDRVLNDETRTVRARVNVANEDLSLRPNMFVRGKVTAALSAAGSIVSRSLAGKYVCPMHQEIVADQPEKCGLCGMALVAAESLGLVSSQPSETQALAVPVTAVLLTGARGVVFVENAKDDARSYELREIELGPRAGDWYLVQSGLKEGERVATRGAVLIDSALQLRGKPSLMSAPPTPLDPPPVSRYKSDAAYHAAARSVVQAYFDLAGKLADDAEPAAISAAGKLQTAIEQMNPAGLGGADAGEFERLRAALLAAAKPPEKPDLKSLRDALPATTKLLREYLRTFGHTLGTPIVRTHCPMAFDNRGADWLAPDEIVRNPYFGAEMLSCGVAKAFIAADGKETE
ncbi:MAG: efflux RND transporter periplasmic adaptor subunit [Phycisphaerales bacterium]|nr:efflux RND transporter periplasmic adaptor subunit [Phycisphaerales bacterium]